ncbi:tryptophan decarboxylase TDC2-like [Nymphaea colorata]|nr:tryptophan decarboxylase TDC2-like [Nymphaea colorata]
MGSLRQDSCNPDCCMTEGFQPLQAEEFRKQAHIMVDFIADYYKNIEKYPVRSVVKPGYLQQALPASAPYHSEPLEDILDDVRRLIMPGITHWLSPNFFAYFPATYSTAGFLGEMLSSSFNVVGFNWLASPAATELETVVMDWLAGLLKLPSSFMFAGGNGGGGVIHGTTSEAMLCTVVAARERALNRIGGANGGRLVVYASDQTHSTFAKACKLAGIAPTNIRALATSASHDFALSPSLVRAAMQADVAAGLVPLYFCATVGTTSSNAVDSVQQLGQVAAEFGAWFHVDAAYAGSACICPEFRPYLDGVELADSLSMSPHKWLLSGLDCCCLWVRDSSALTRALSTNPEYLRNEASESKAVIDYKDWQIGTGRKFRALRLWMVLRSYGVARLQSHIRSDVRLAKRFEGLVEADERFEIVTPRRFALVCFRMKVEAGRDGAEANRELMEAVNRTGKAYMTHTVVGGGYVLRFAVGASLTEERHVDGAWSLVQEKAKELMSRAGLDCGGE